MSHGGETSGLLALGLQGLPSAAAAPQDKIAIQASRSGFKPNLITIRKGEVVHLILTTADVEHCFAVDALRIEKRIVPGKATEFDLVSDHAGTWPFYCCLEGDEDAQRGRIVVTE